jgi:hypothetical protein
MVRTELVGTVADGVDTAHADEADSEEQRDHEAEAPAELDRDWKVSEPLHGTSVLDLDSDLLSRMIGWPKRRLSLAPWRSSVLGVEA